MRHVPRILPPQIHQIIRPRLLETSIMGMNGGNPLPFRGQIIYPRADLLIPALLTLIIIKQRIGIEDGVDYKAREVQVKEGSMHAMVAFRVDFPLNHPAVYQIAVIAPDQAQCRVDQPQFTLKPRVRLWMQHMRTKHKSIKKWA